VKSVTYTATACVASHSFHAHRLSSTGLTTSARIRTHVCVMCHKDQNLPKQAMPITYTATASVVQSSHMHTMGTTAVSKATMLRFATPSIATQALCVCMYVCAHVYVCEHVHLCMRVGYKATMLRFSRIP
jgi:hypothetical protein